MRILVAIAAVVALAVPAAAYDTTWDGEQEGDITIYLDLNCYIQIQWQDVEIHFDGTNDWWSAVRCSSAYQGPGGDDQGKTSIDPWAGDSYYGTRYFESGDGGYVYVKSNNVLWMDVHSEGDLSAQPDTLCPAVTIPTWFTVAFSGPFYVEGQDIGTCTIPQDGWGTYGYDPGDHSIAYGASYPNQDCFPMDPASQIWTLGPLCPYVEGNINFKARIERNGLADAGGNYTTALNLSFYTVE